MTRRSKHKLQTWFFDFLGHAWPQQAKIIVSTNGKLCRLTARQKLISFQTSLLGYHNHIADLSGYLMHV